MEIVINESNLKDSDINDFSYKARALLIDSQNRILVANYADVYLLPGGKIDSDDTAIAAAIRELQEELGTTYVEDELTYFAEIDYYQENYLKRDGKTTNRLVKTTYFIGEYKDINIRAQSLTEKEKSAGFSLELIDLDEIENIIMNFESTNPRNKYFQKELLVILELYKKQYNIEKNIKKW